MEQELLKGFTEVKTNSQGRLKGTGTISKRVTFLEPCESKFRKGEAHEMKELGAPTGSILRKRMLQVSDKEKELPEFTSPIARSTSSGWWQKFMFGCCKVPNSDEIEEEGAHGGMLNSFPSSTVGLLSGERDVDE